MLYFLANLCAEFVCDVKGNCRQSPTQSNRIVSSGAITAVGQCSFPCDELRIKLNDRPKPTHGVLQLKSIGTNAILPRRLRSLAARLHLEKHRGLPLPRGRGENTIRSARTSASMFCASNAECPASGLMHSSAFGHTACRSNAPAPGRPRRSGRARSRGDVRHLRHIAQQLVVGVEEPLVHEVMVLDARERQREARIAVAGFCNPSGCAGNSCRLPRCSTPARRRSLRRPSLLVRRRW